MATMGGDRNYAAIVHGIITIAHNLNMEVTAEGVETQEQLAQILGLDCDYAQGFLFSPPVDSPTAAKMIRGHEAWRMSA